jgi:hypothetical protein
MTSPSAASSSKAVDVVDLDELVKKWATQMFEYTKSKDHARIPKEHLAFNVDWKRVRFVHHEPEYIDKRKSATPKSQILYRTHFTNNTDLDQEYSFRAERTTSSVCEVHVERAVTVGCEMNLSLKTPCDVFEANAGFKREVCVTKCQGEIVEQTMTWGVDSLIRVPPMTRTSAELVVYEDTFDGNFSVRSDVSGKLLVSVMNLRDNNNFLKSIEGDIIEIIRRETENNGLKGFTFDSTQGVITYVTRGRCSYRYGIEQHVQLSQQKL